MDRNIKIEIKDRVAHLVGNPKIICGNNDYSVTFTFDDEWTGVDVKTLRVSYNNKYSDHVFSGDTVELPPIIKAVEVYLGVFAGDITSTKVAVRAEPSILCEGGSVADPEPDVYNQIIDLLNSKEPSGGIAQESDPTVPAWAKEPNKPEYTAEEVGAASIEDVERLTEEKVDQFTVGDGLQMSEDRVLSAVGGAEFEPISTVTVEKDVRTVIIDTEPDGSPYNFKAMLLRITVDSRTVNYSNGAYVAFTSGGKRIVEVAASGLINNNVLMSTIIAYSMYGRWFAYNLGAISPSNNGGSTTVTTIPNKNGINTTSDYASLTGFELYLSVDSIPAGTIIEISGVRA